VISKGETLVFNFLHEFTVSLWFGSAIWVKLCFKKAKSTVSNCRRRNKRLIKAGAL
jgi:hypothetical protein